MPVIPIKSSVSFDSNIYLLIGRSALLIDTGTGLDSDNVISQIWKSLNGIRLSAVLLTHCHADHIGGLKDIIDEFGCPAYISEPDLPAAESGDPEVTFAGRMGLQLPRIALKKMLPTDVFDIGDHIIHVIPTPGHTIGSVCFLDSVTSSLFSGDTVFERGYGRTDLPTGSAIQIADSITKLCNVNIGTLYPGHGPIALHGSKSIADAKTMLTEVSY